jgi:DNA-binding transcriptional LysR family regulator
MDRLAAMTLFVRVAELGSFSAAAQQLGIARSVVTRQIAALETHLGVKLMARSTRRLALTPAGNAYLERCRVILNLVESAETGIAEDRRSPRGLIRLSLPLTFGLKKVTPLLLEFTERYPEVSLQLDYTDRRVHLIEEGIDLSIRITLRLAPSDVARKIGEIEMRTIASPQYLARHGRPEHPSELLQHECLAYTSTGDAQTWQYVAADAPLNVPIRDRISANNGEALVAAAVQGLGITYQPDFIVEDQLKTGQVEEILASFQIPKLGIYAMLPSNRQVPHRVRVLMDFLAEQLVETK